VLLNLRLPFMERALSVNKLDITHVATCLVALIWIYSYSEMSVFSSSHAGTVLWR